MVFAFYTYNSLGYITNVKKNGTTIAAYSYDALGQLVGETVNNQIYIYSYDKAGNITKKEVYTGDIGNLTDTINYTYSTSSWGDLLTNYDGTAITYDSIGNPTNWRNSSSLTWNGRTLTSQTLTNGNSITYKYNSDGIRTQKRVFDDVASAYITHDYVLDGTKIIQETVTDNAYYNSYTLYYVYDANGSITGLHYNGTPYYFQKSIQGDVLRICNAGGAVVVEYTYDAWGNIISVTGSMASTLGQYNPFRYRSYYYDTETDLYYLNSRYYDAEVGRFINADSYVSTGQGILGNNMFAYCGNNPANHIDIYGERHLDFDGLNSYNEIHNAVQAHIVLNYANIRTEVRAGTSVLRIDILESEEYIYEVKPCTHRSAAGRAAAYIQLTTYSQLSGYELGTNVFYGKFEHGEYTVVYWTEASLIFYDFYKTEEKVKVEVPVLVPAKKKSDLWDKAKATIESAKDYLTTSPGGTTLIGGAGCLAVTVMLSSVARHQLRVNG